MAALGVSSEFDYFAPQVIADDIEEEYLLAVSTKNAIVDKQPLEFTIPAENGIYRDLNSSLIEVTCQITQKDGTALADNAAIAPVNLLLHALFKSAEIQLNGKRVSDANNYYAERAYVEKLLNCSQEALKTRTICEGWAIDDAAKMNAVVLTGEANAGFVKRAKWCEKSRVMKLVGRLHCDLFHQPLDIPDGVKIDIKLDQNPDSKILMAAAAGNCKLTLQSARLLVRSKRLSPDLVLAHRKLLDIKNYQVPFTRVIVKTDTVGTGMTEVTRTNFHQGSMPSRVTVFMVRSVNSTGALDKNPFLFENFGLTNIWLKIGKNKYPNEDLVMNYAEGQYYNAYLNTLTSLGIDQGERTLAITPDDWSTSFNVYTFKLTPGPSSPSVLHAAHSQQVVIELYAKFSAALTEPITIFGYIEEPALLEIDKLGNIIV